jgi:hypothetical protein
MFKYLKEQAGQVAEKAAIQAAAVREKVNELDLDNKTGQATGWLKENVNKASNFIEESLAVNPGQNNESECAQSTRGYSANDSPPPADDVGAQAWLDKMDSFIDDPAVGIKQPAAGEPAAREPAVGEPAAGEGPSCASSGGVEGQPTFMDFQQARRGLQATLQAEPAAAAPAPAPVTAGGAGLVDTQPADGLTAKQKLAARKAERAALAAQPASATKPGAQPPNSDSESVSAFDFKAHTGGSETDDVDGVLETPSKVIGAGVQPNDDLDDL